MPPKMASKEEEKRNRLLERKESDLTRLTAAKSKLEGQQRHWEEKKERLGRMVVRPRDTLTQTDRKVEEQRKALAKAQRALDLSTQGAKRYRRDLTELQVRLRDSKEALERVRADLEVREYLRNALMHY